MWAARTFCATRAALLRCVGEYCGEFDRSALVERLPERYGGLMVVDERRAA